MPATSRSDRKALAEETLAILDRGSYVAAAGRAVDISASVWSCLTRTRYYVPDDLEYLHGEILTRPTAARLPVATLDSPRPGTRAAGFSRGRRRRRNCCSA